MPPRALVTGAGGFLGSHICQHFTASGYQVWACGRLLAGAAGQGLLGGVAGVLEIDFPSPSFIRHLDEIRPELLVHCASSASVPLSMKDPVADFRQSAGIYADILEAVRIASPGTVVAHLSSAAVYGQPRRIPTSEDEPPSPLSPYGFHKWVCELLSREYAEIYGIKTMNLRIFSAYGEGLFKQVVFDTLARIADPSVRVMELFGTGDETRDFLHAVDVASAILKIHESGISGTFNVASGTPTSIRHLVELINARSRTPKPFRFRGESRPGDPDRWCADISHLASTGFAPSVSLDEGIGRVTEWYERLQRTIQ